MQKVHNSFKKQYSSINFLTGSKSLYRQHLGLLVITSVATALLKCALITTFETFPCLFISAVNKINPDY